MVERPKLLPRGTRLEIEYLNVFSFQGVFWGSSSLKLSRSVPALLPSIDNPLIKESVVSKIADS